MVVSGELMPEGTGTASVTKIGNLVESAGYNGESGDFVPGTGALAVAGNPDVVGIDRMGRCSA
ncbi:MAG: hypothetical protein KDA68_06940 [Planctomycetaceae bacterium]|nr:hypothetical protein [Planctomycetaceae bacterium]